MTMLELRVVPTLEKLPTYGADACGLTMSVGASFDGILGDDERGWLKAFLMPWSWSPSPPDRKFLPVTEVRVFFRDSTGKKKVETDVEVRGRKDLNSALKEKLEARYDLVAKQNGGAGNPFIWPLPAEPMTRGFRFWSAFLGQLSLLPWPIPQQLGLSGFLKITRPADTADLADLVVAPVLRLTKGGRLLPVPRDPAAAPIVGLENKVVMDYAFEPGPDHDAAPSFTFRAITVPCPLKTNNGTLFDFDSLWVKRAPGQKSTDGLNADDWRAGLENRLADQLNLSQLLVDWMKANEADAQKVYPRLCVVTLDHLREATAPGVRDGSPGGPLFLRAFRAVDDKALDERAAEEVLKKVRLILADDAQSPSTWVTCVSEALTATSVSSLAEDRKNDKDGSGVKPSRLLETYLKGDAEKLLERDFSLSEAIAALQQLITRLAESATSKALFTAQWAKLNKELVSDAQLTKEQKGFALRYANLVVERFDVPHQYALDHLGKHWLTLRKRLVGTSAAAVESALKTALQEMLGGILDGEVKKTGQFVEAAEKIAKRVLLREDPQLEAGAREARRQTRGISVDVDALSEDQGATDLLAQIQGVALLMRKEMAKQWLCLNLAKASVDGQLLHDPVLLPSRLAYLNGLRAPTLTYDNLPLTVESPLAADTVSGVELVPPSAAAGGLDEPIITFSYSTKTGWPGLVFGQKYDIVPFLVTNAGGVPASIAGESLADGPQGIKADLQQLQGADVRSGYIYRREVHVGALRVEPQGRTEFPPVPAGVSLRCRELAPDRVLPANDPLTLNAAGKPLDEKLIVERLLGGTPALFLVPHTLPQRLGIGVTARYQFSVAPPMLDLKTWDRWFAADPAHDRQRRKFVWRSFYWLQHENAATEGPQVAKFPRQAKPESVKKTGAYLDDPAVKGVWVELCEVSEAQAPLVMKPQGGIKPYVSLKPRKLISDFAGWKSMQPGLATEQAEEIGVVCEAADDKTLQVEVGGKAVTYSVPADKTYRLSFYAVLADGSAAKFRDQEHVRIEDGHNLTSPWHLLIEVAQGLPTKDLRNQLWEALQAKWMEVTGEINVSLDLDSADLKPLGRLVHRAELLRQVWAWRGRPVARHPDLAPKAANGDEVMRYYQFELSEFGDRGDDERAVRPMGRKDPAKQWGFSWSEKPGDDGPRGDRRALHHRVAARVFSRYEGVLPENQGDVETMHLKTKTRWRRVFVPCRVEQPVEVPKVKLVLPLTQERTPAPEKGRPAGPGLLVVVDGAWHEVGGLAEVLEAEVVQVSRPDCDPIAPKPEACGAYYQLGTDPIITGKSALSALTRGGNEGDWPAISTKDYAVVFDEVIGAIGHHRERTQTAPRFLASSFILPPPRVIKSDGKKDIKVDFAWWFLKLRFRRACLGPGPDPQRSQWSAPFWSQLLPGVERVEEDWFGTQKLAVSLRNGVISVDRGRPPARTGKADEEGHLHEENDPVQFQILGVLTRLVADISGRPGQEAYAGYCAWNGSKWVTQPPLDAPVTSESLRVRWLEVQSRDTGFSTLSPWEALFKSDIADDKRARIVRISRPARVEVK
ncbi:MAG TPA: hypothetical protein VHQ90_19310 [Thermoanaerobaculia bacterium]|nr:hypothetical protein [Thermoanaerobaculia bacterium]